jgi:hypothetical protein
MLESLPFLRGFCVCLAECSMVQRERCDVVREGRVCVNVELARCRLVCHRAQYCTVKHMKMGDTTHLLCVLMLSLHMRQQPFYGHPHFPLFSSCLTIGDVT